jgi:hypothetical protein
VAAGELEQLVRLGQDRAALGRAGDADAPPAPELEQALVAQQAQRPERRVGVDAEDRGEVAGGRQPLARPVVGDQAGLPRGDGADRLQSRPGGDRAAARAAHGRLGLSAASASSS